MSQPISAQQAMRTIREATHVGPSKSDAPVGCSMSGVRDIKQRRITATCKPLILALLVVFGLMQVATNLINSRYKHNHLSSESQILLSPCQVPSRCSYPFSHDNGASISRCSVGESDDDNQRACVQHNSYSSRRSKGERAQNCRTMHTRDISSEQADNDEDSYSSSPTLFERLLAVTVTRPLARLESLYNTHVPCTNPLWSPSTARSIFGASLLLADAAQLTASPMYQPSHDREIIILNSTNFNTELIQYNHPFPHIKLIEYYLPYCRICLRFKQTYIQLSKDIHSWRNVIRPSAIDLGVSNNSPIALSWSIDVVPTLRIHPPPKSTLAAKFNEQLGAWSNSMKSNELQRAMYQEYSSASLMIKTLGVIKYTNDSKRDANAPDKVSLLRQDLLRYIEEFVRNHPDEVPETWPNLRPVTEKTLADLRRHHPRQELFLIIETGKTSLDSDQVPRPGVGLEIMMELSSSSAWRSVRYVRAMDNRELIKDVITYKKKELSDLTNDSQSNSSEEEPIVNEQVKLLHASLSEAESDNGNVILVHIDDSHSPYSHSANAPSTKFPSLKVITSPDLITTEQQVSNYQRESERKDANQYERSKRSERPDDDFANLSLARKIELITFYVNQTYLETKEDHEFQRALARFDDNPTSHNSKREAIEKLQATRQEIQLTHDNIGKQGQRGPVEDGNNSTFTLLLNKFNPSHKDSFLSSAMNNINDKSHDYDDYEDKLKAIRYIFVQEVPRKLLADKSPAEKLEKLNTLINLASVIRAYFPLPDLASVQFIDAIHSYLSKQQTLLSASLNGQDQITNNFELRSLKQVIKTLEVEGKRLPEVSEWKHCKYGGYPCALWRLFHTLAAFEYRKLSQINQVSAPSSSHQHLISSIETHSPATLESQPQAQISDPAMTSSTLEQQQQQQQQHHHQQQQQQQNNPPSPVERLVSPPSTTTSLSLTIATPISSHGQQNGENQNSKKYAAAEMVELPTPVILVMRDYIVDFFTCEECARNFRQESADLSFERIRQQESAEFSVLWLWETHNRVSKRLSINPETNPPEHPKKWFPSYEQCSRCYKKPPSYLKDTSVELAAIFHESIEWDREEILNYLQSEYTRQPMDSCANIFGYPLPAGFNYMIIIGLCSFLLIIILRCASYYIERQRRHKASMLNGVQYSEELQRT